MYFTNYESTCMLMDYFALPYSLQWGSTHEHCWKNDHGIRFGRGWYDWIWGVLQGVGTFRRRTENVHSLLELRALFEGIERTSLHNLLLNDVIDDQKYKLQCDKRGRVNETVNHLTMCNIVSYILLLILNNSFGFELLITIGSKGMVLYFQSYYFKSRLLSSQTIS